MGPDLSGKGLEDLLKTQKVEFDVLSDLVKGLAGDNQCREKYNYAFENVPVVEGYQLDMPTPETRFLPIIERRGVVQGIIRIKPSGFLKKEVFHLNYSRGQDSWMLSINYKDTFVQALEKVVSKYISNNM
jgi:hypothetical protein